MNVWIDPQTQGNYDIVIDVNGNDMYDEGVDALDDSDIEVMTGVEVIPELSVFILLLLFGIGTVVAMILRRRLRL